MTKSEWYKQGLQFKCTACGKCCSGHPGYVWVNLQEMQAIADFLKISLQTFMRTYVRRVGQRYSLIEYKKNYECVFLKDKKCQIYEARPTQCRTFPFWPQNLRSKASWEEAAKSCEGISSDAPVVDQLTIEKEKLTYEKNSC